VRELFFPVFDYVKSRGLTDIIAQSPALLQQSVDSDAFRRHCEYHDGASWRLCGEVLYPDSQLAPPQELTIYREGSESVVNVTLTGDDWSKAHRLITSLVGSVPITQPPSDVETELISLLADEGLVNFTSTEKARRRALDVTDLTFVGHNTVLARSPESSVIVDPFFQATSPQYPSSYQPLTRRELGKVDAVLITHSHPDHFDPASLLQFDPATRIIVPEVGRETILTVDMAARLRELGFENYETLKWNQCVQLPGMEVHALPFYGEQPSNLSVFHPEIRNAGNTYVVRTARYSAALVADSGRDAAGDIKEVAKEWRQRWGAVDVLFAGYRGWQTYPVQLLFSSVSKYLLFVPPQLWNTCLQLMNNIEDAIELAEHWGARYLVPYGDGGAPWYWQIGLGPRLDDDSFEDPAFDPFPERVLDCAKQRKRDNCASSTEPLLLRPGESIAEVSGRASIVQIDGHIWPYHWRG
jgi:hypothetical protein